MTIYLIRHGTTVWNAIYKIQGASDIPLDDIGEAIAKATGEALIRSGLQFQHVFSSPLSRAYRTAELVAPGAGICTDQRLRELSFGDFEGRFVPDMTNDPSCAFRFFKSDPYRYNEEIIALNAISGTKRYESLADLLGRAESFVEDVVSPLALSAPENTNILISGHGAVNKALLMAFSKNKDLHSFWGKGLQRNCGINLITACADASGAVRHEVDETTRVYYDPEAFGGVRNLL